MVDRLIFSSFRRCIGFAVADILCLAASFSSASWISFKSLVKKNVGRLSFHPLNLSCSSIISQSTAPLISCSTRSTCGGDRPPLCTTLLEISLSFSGSWIKVLLGSAEEVEKQGTGLLQTQRTQKPCCMV